MSNSAYEKKLKGLVEENYPLAKEDLSPDAFKKAIKQLKKTMKQKKAIGGPIENPLEKKQNPLYREELGMYGGGAVRKKMYARGGGTRPTRG